MSAISKTQPLDDIETFLPGIPAEEYDLRAKLRSYRNAATAMVHDTGSETARCLAWLTIDYVTWSIYSPVSDATLVEIGRLCKRLMLTAILAEQIDDFGTAP